MRLNVSVGEFYSSLDEKQKKEFDIVHIKDIGRWLGTLPILPPIFHSSLEAHIDRGNLEHSFRHG